jgi:negative regulator of flagellin synthesis FlgM
MEVVMAITNGISGLQQTAAPSDAWHGIQVSASDSLPKDGEVSATNVLHADQADVSSAGGLVAQALEGSDIRSAKVASLQQAIAAGSYSVSSSDVADKIIQSCLD